MDVELHESIIDVCMANDRLGWVLPWKTGLPLEALRTLAMQASIGRRLKRCHGN
jgi:hypothetical protein